MRVGTASRTARRPARRFRARHAWRPSAVRASRPSASSHNAGEGGREAGRAVTIGSGVPYVVPVMGYGAAGPEVPPRQPRPAPRVPPRQPGAAPQVPPRQPGAAPQVPGRHLGCRRTIPYLRHHIGDAASYLLTYLLTYLRVVVIHIPCVLTYLRTGSGGRWSFL